MARVEELSRDDRSSRRTHEVSVCPPPGEYAGNEDRWELDCDVCGYIGSGATEAEASKMAGRHSEERP